MSNVSGCCGAEQAMSMDEVKLFVDEALTMNQFDHQHVLSIIGISFDVNSLPMVVLPFMQHGDLRSFIRDERNVSCCCCSLPHAEKITTAKTYRVGLKAKAGVMNVRDSKTLVDTVKVETRTERERERERERCWMM